jgi:oligoribonuclease NrnB/cAMP/cGMP phosphodiesterase (DHH superfamily)
MKPLVIYHADCTDGFGAAFAAWLKFGSDADYYAARYGDKDLPDWQGREVYILDFSFPRALMDDAFQLAKHVVWLDHHKTAFEMWIGGLFDGTEGRHEQHDQVRDIVLDFDKSGALLAWEYFHPGAAIPKLIQHIDDRDRWQFKLDGSKELHAALQSYKPWSFEQWKEDFVWLDPTGEPEMLLPACFTRYKTLLEKGAAILRAQEQHVAELVKQARRVYVPCVLSSADFLDSTANGLAVNTPIHMSEVGHELANQSGTYGLVWYVGADTRVKCSLRSNGEYDVSGIARQFGGGGHRNAAGFETDISTLVGWLA